MARIELARNKYVSKFATKYVYSYVVTLDLNLKHFNRIYSSRQKKVYIPFRS